MCWVQKPMTASVAESKAAVALARQKNLKLMVSFFELFLPPVERAKQIIDKGLIGTPFLFKAIMAWHTPDVTAGWRFNPDIAGGGVLLDGNVHHVANALYLLGNPKIESVYAEYGALTADIKVEDTAVILVRTDKAILEISGSNRLQEPGAGQRRPSRINGRYSVPRVRSSGTRRPARLFACSPAIRAQ